MWNRIFQAFSVTLLIVLVFFLLNRPSFEGDSLALIQGVTAIHSCLQSGHWSPCENSGHFPLFQQIPALGLHLMGFSEGTIAHCLAYLSFALFLSWFWMFRRAWGKRSQLLLPWIPVLLLSGYAIRYINSTFGEVLAATFILGMVTSRLLNVTPWITAALLFGSVITKETAFPFACAFLVLASMDRTRLFSRREWILFGSSTVLGIAANFLFNLFRMGTLLNDRLLIPQYIVTDTRIQFSFLRSIWFSPSGGVAVFWLSAFATIVASVYFGFRDFKKVGWRSAKVIVPLGTLGLLFLLSLGFSKWYAPLGWYAWGPRLMLPWIPPAVLLAVYFQATSFESRIRQWARRGNPWFWPTTAVLAFSAFPHFRVLLRYQWVNRLIDWPGCPPNASSFECSAYKLWPDSWPILKIYLPSYEPAEFAGAFLMTAVLIYGLLLCRKRALEAERLGFDSMHSPLHAIGAQASVRSR